MFSGGNVTVYVSDMERAVRFYSETLGELARGVDNQGRLVAFAAFGNGSEIRSVGFQQDAIGGSFPGCGLQFKRLRERHDAAETQVETEIERTARLGGTPGKAVHN